jgi:hypothetical protein
MRRATPIAGALPITATEATARRLIRGRAGALLLAYPVLGGLALVAGPPPAHSPRTSFGPPVLAGFALALAGYPLGR